MSHAFKYEAAREPISGAKRTKKESIVAMARRHGWTVKERTDPGDLVESVDLTKGDKTAYLYLYPNTRSIASAVINRVPVECGWGTQGRERVEMYLIGVECVCAAPYEVPHFEQDANPRCPIHGDQ